MFTRGLHSTFVYVLTDLVVVPKLWRKVISIPFLVGKIMLSIIRDELV